MNIVQKWLSGLIALGAIGLVVANPTGVAKGLGAAQSFIQGTEHTAITGKVN